MNVELFGTDRGNTEHSGHEVAHKYEMGFQIRIRFSGG